MTIRDLQNAVENKVERSCKRILESDSSESMTYQYYGASAIISFCETNNIINHEMYKKYDAMIEKAHEDYYKKAKSDFESAHKRLF